MARNAKGQAQTEARLTTISKMEGDFQSSNSKSFSAIQKNGNDQDIVNAIAVAKS
jgi:hypothetical protein